jgi:hypothetical protein
MPFCDLVVCTAGSAKHEAAQPCAARCGLTMHIAYLGVSGSVQQFRCCCAAVEHGRLCVCHVQQYRTWWGCGDLSSGLVVVGLLAPARNCTAGQSRAWRKCMQCSKQTCTVLQVQEVASLVACCKSIPYGMQQSHKWTITRVWHRVTLSPAGPGGSLAALAHCPLSPGAYAPALHMTSTAHASNSSTAGAAVTATHWTPTSWLQHSQHSTPMQLQSISKATHWTPCT